MWSLISSIWASVIGFPNFRISSLSFFKRCYLEVTLIARTTVSSLLRSTVITDIHILRCNIYNFSTICYYLTIIYCNVYKGCWKKNEVHVTGADRRFAIDHSSHFCTSSSHKITPVAWTVRHYTCTKSVFHTSYFSDNLNYCIKQFEYVAPCRLYNILHKTV